MVMWWICDRGYLMGDNKMSGMTKQEAIEVGILKKQVGDTHELVVDIHDVIYKNGLLVQVKDNTKFREDCEIGKKEKAKHKYDWSVWIIRLVVGVTLVTWIADTVKEIIK